MSAINVDGVQDSDGVVFKTLPAGIYPGRIESCEWAVVDNAESRFNGATYLKYSVKAVNPEDEVAVTMQDTIFLPCDAMDAEQMRKSRAKLKRLQIACGLEEMGNSIDNEAFMYADLQVEVGVQKERTDKITGAVYPERNVIRDTLPL